MKTTTITLLVSLFLLIAGGANVYAADFEATDLAYDITSSSPGSETVTVAGLASGNSNATSISIPDEVSNNGTTYKVTAIKADAFRNNRVITSVTIGNNVETIGSDAFNGCWALTSATIGNNVTTIEDRAFSVCVGLPNITFPNGLETIGEEAFSNCPIVSINLPESVTTIGDAAFAMNSALTSITIPSKVTIINDGLFSGCSALTSVIFKGQVTSVGKAVFTNCSNLTSVTFMVEAAPTFASLLFGYYSVPDNLTFYVPKGAKEAYLGALSAYPSIKVSDGTNPAPVPPVTYNWYNVSIPAAEGVTIVRNDREFDSYKIDVIEGSIFSFSLQAKEGYDLTNVVVTTNRGDVITPHEEDGRYIIREVNEDIEITIKGSTPLANEEIGRDGTAIYAANGEINVEVTEAVTAYVYTAAGALKYSGILSAGSNRIYVSGAGIYFVRLSNGAVKKVAL